MPSEIETQTMSAGQRSEPMTDDPGGERLFNMIEALIRSGAEVWIGKRRVRVEKKDADGSVKITFNRRVWVNYVAHGRWRPLPAPPAQKEG